MNLEKEVAEIIKKNALMSRIDDVGHTWDWWTLSAGCIDQAATEIIKWFLDEVLPKDKDNINASFSNRNLKFSDGWTYCLAEVRRRLEE